MATKQAGSKSPAPEKETTSGDVASFDPWTATFEEANGHSDTNHFVRWGAALEVSTLQTQIEAGDGCAVMDAVAKCARYELVMPSWLSAAFIERHRLVRSFQVKTWDEAFGAPIPKGTHLEKEQKYLQFKTPVLMTVIALLNQDPKRGVDKDLFNDVAHALGNQRGLKGSVCMEIYGRAKREYGMNPAKIRKFAV